MAEPAVPRPARLYDRDATLAALARAVEAAADTPDADVLAAVYWGLATPPGRRYRGTVTRWGAGTTAGFVTAEDGTSWFASQDSVPGRQPLPVGTRVTFAGRPKPRPGKRYPEAFNVEVEEGGAAPRG